MQVMRNAGEWKSPLFQFWAFLRPPRLDLSSGGLFYNNCVFCVFTHVFPVIDLFDLLQHPVHYNDRIVLRVISQSGICELILFPERFTLLVAIHITQPDILVTQTVQIHTQLCDDPASNAMPLHRTFHHKESDEAALFRWIMVNKVHHSHKLLGIIKNPR